MTDSEWKPPGADEDARKAYPGAAGPPLSTPPVRLSTQRLTAPPPAPPVWPARSAHPTYPASPPMFVPPPPPAGGAWQGAVRPPRFLAQQAAARSITRPTYREPLPVRSGPVSAGAGIGALWMLLWGIQAGTFGSYLILTGIAGALGWVGSAVLARYGDRGVAVGGAAVTGIGVTIAAVAALVQLT